MERNTIIFLILTPFFSYIIYLAIKNIFSDHPSKSKKEKDHNHLNEEDKYDNNYQRRHS